MVRPIIKYPDSLLFRQSEPWTFNLGESNIQLKILLDDMFDTMYHTKVGIGLAAVQIGVLRQVAVIEINHANNRLVLINPKITTRSDRKTVREGCLSIPGKIVELTRFNLVEVEFQDECGKNEVRCYSGIMAQAVQHEIDHMNGKLIVGDKDV